MYKIANWNLERPKLKTEKTKLATEKIKEINADIIVLTETSKAVDLSELYPFQISNDQPVELNKGVTLFFESRKN